MKMTEIPFDKPETLLEILPLKTAFEIVCAKLKEEHDNVKQIRAMADEMNNEYQKLKAKYEVQHKENIELRNTNSLLKGPLLKIIAELPSAKTAETVVRDFMEVMKNKSEEQRTTAKNILLAIGHIAKLPDELMNEIMSLDDLQQAGPTANQLHEEHIDIVEKLAPCFYGNEKDAREFLAAIRGMQPVQITALVNDWVKERKISDRSKKRPLWKVLHNAGLYDRTDRTWNSQVN